MDVAEPRTRRRGFVVFQTDPNLDLDDESESAEGVTVRVRIARPKLHRQISVTSSRTSHPTRRGSSRQPEGSSSHTPDDPAAVKSMTATGIRQRSHSPR